MVPFKHILLALALVSSLSTSAFSQVKRQYQDEAFAQTTVVVKENTTHSSDLDILDDQFDIDDFGMHQVIRITTETNRPKSPEKEMQPAQNAETAVNTTLNTTRKASPQIIIDDSAEAPKWVVRNKKTKRAVVKKAASPQIQSESSNTSSSITSARNFRSSTPSKTKLKKKKLKKRKRFKKAKRSKCYKF